MKTTPKDFFINLGNLIAFYLLIISTGSVLFDFIDLLIPDEAANLYFQYGQKISPFAIASIIVSLPLFFFLSKLVKKDIVASPEKMELRSRRWMIYLSLFIAGLVTAGDIVGIIYGFLTGFLALSSFAKMLAVLILAGGSFWYLLKELKIETLSLITKRSVAITTGIMYILIIGASVLVANPQEARDRRLDEKTINDLNTAVYEIDTFYADNQKLPDNVSVEGIEFIPSKDIAQKGKYTLCAEFKSEMSDTRNDPYNPWKYTSKGRNCFDKTVSELNILKQTKVFNEGI